MADTTIISRKELYQRAWQTPLTKLAEEFGISSRGLEKICQRHDIPYPPRGYWSRRRAGKTVGVTKLPPSRWEADHAISISRTEKIALNLTEVADEQFKKIGTSKIIVPEGPGTPHSIIVRWNRVHGRPKGQHPNFVQARTAQSDQLEGRRQRICDVLFKEWERLGHSVEGGETPTRLRFLYGGEAVAVEFREQLRQKKEVVESYIPGKFRTEVQYLPKGLLQFEIRTLDKGLKRRRWSDVADKVIEESLGDILRALILAGEMEVERARRWKVTRAAEAEMERLVREERERRGQDQRRWEKFLATARQHEEATAARRFLAAIELRRGQNSEDSDAVAAWIIWASEKIDTLDPLAGPLSDLIENVERV